MDFVRHVLQQVLQELPGGLSASLVDQLRDSELAGPVDGDEQIELAFGRSPIIAEPLVSMARVNQRAAFIPNAQTAFSTKFASSGHSTGRVDGRCRVKITGVEDQRSGPVDDSRPVQTEEDDVVIAGFDFIRDRAFQPGCRIG